MITDRTHLSPSKTRFGQATAPAFSIIVPCRDAAVTIEETLQSVLAQTFSDWEVVLINDGSIDETPDILGRWAKSDSRFRVYDRPCGGPSRSRNFGAFKYARGEYLAFLDADDIWSPHKLEAMARVLRACPNLDGLYARVAFFRGSPDLARSSSTVLSSPLSPAALLRDNRVCTMSNLVVRAERFQASGGFDVSMFHAEDLEWLVRVTARGMRIEGLNEQLVYYRTSDDGLSSDLERMHSGWKKAVASAQRCGLQLAPATLRATEAANLRYLARRALRVGAPRFTALRFAMRGALRSPSGFFGESWRGAFTFLAACLEPAMPAGLRRFVFSP